MRFLTAGESHGRALNAIVEGFPANVRIDIDRINRELKRRQQGYGRGGRMKIEDDRVEILAGLRGCITTGAPISLMITNADYVNWEDAMDALAGDRTKHPVFNVRPGHADLCGVMKYKAPDARYIFERASARETAIRTAVGALAKELLYALDISVASHVTAIGGLRAKVQHDKNVIKDADENELRCLDYTVLPVMKQAIDMARANGDTLGGEAEIIAFNVRAGIGSFVHYDRKLDYRFMGAVGSIQGIKAVAIGDGFKMGDLIGSQAHDEIFIEGNNIFRNTNRAGGIEGGMSNGEEIIIRAIMKPIPTLMRGLQTVDIKEKKAATASTERSDVCAVPAMGVVAENVLAFELADAILETTGGDHLDEVAVRYFAK